MVSLSTSTKIGCAPQYLIELHVATKVKGCVITSLSFSTPASNNDMCSADVPLLVATAYLTPQYSAIFLLAY